MLFNLIGYQRSTLCCRGRVIRGARGGWGLQLQSHPAGGRGALPGVRGVPHPPAGPDARAEPHQRAADPQGLHRQRRHADNHAHHAQRATHSHPGTFTWLFSV